MTLQKKLSMKIVTGSWDPVYVRCKFYALDGPLEMGGSAAMMSGGCASQYFLSFLLSNSKVDL